MRGLHSKSYFKMGLLNKKFEKPCSSGAGAQMNGEFNVNNDLMWTQNTPLSYAVSYSYWI